MRRGRRGALHRLARARGAAGVLLCAGPCGDDRRQRAGLPEEALQGADAAGDGAGRRGADPAAGLRRVVGRREELGYAAGGGLLPAQRAGQALARAGDGVLLQRAPDGAADDAGHPLCRRVPAAAHAPARPGHGADLLRHDAGDVLRRLRQRAADHRGPGRRRGRGGAGLQDVRACEGARGNVAQPVERPAGQGLPDHPGAAGHRLGRAVRRGLGTGHAGEDSGVLQRLYLRRHLRAAGPGVRRAAAGGVCAADSARRDGHKPLQTLV